MEGADTILGGGGNDTIDGGQGDDLLLGGKGDDVLIWAPGGGSDTIDGGAGTDTHEFRMADAAESISLSGRADGHAVLTRDVGLVTMDIANVEQILIGGSAGGGADLIEIDDLSGTSIRQVDIDLGSIPDGASDEIITFGRGTNDRFTLATTGGALSISGLQTGLTVSHADATDHLVLSGAVGADVLDISAGGGAAIEVDFDGGDGFDSVVANGGATNDILQLTGAGDQLSVTANGQAINTVLTGVEAVLVNAGDGNDQVDARGLSLANEMLSISGGNGADAMVGSGGVDTLDGGADNDTIDGGAGNDVLLGGKGDDVLIWAPGGGSDTIDGGAGADTHEFRMANVTEVIGLSARADGHAVLTRDIGTVTMDIANVERILIDGAGGGADLVAIGDLSGTSVRQVDIDLGEIADDASDQITTIGQATSDRIALTTANGVLSVSGLQVGLTVSHADVTDHLALSGAAGNDVLDISAGGGAAIEADFDGGAGVDTVVAASGAANDTLVLTGAADAALGDQLSLTLNGQAINTRLSGVEAVTVNSDDGDDFIDAHNLGLGSESLSITAGDGADLVLGSRGIDTIDAGAGNDTVDGGAGDDVLVGGKGDDVLIWAPGGGSDTLDGGAGTDIHEFQTSNLSEVIGLEAQSDGHAILTRDVGTVTMNLDNIEHVIFRGQSGGTDTFDIGDLSTTEIRQVDVDLGSLGASDGLLDSVILTGSAAADRVIVAATGSAIAVTGLGAGVSIANTDAADRLIIATGVGDDTFDASALNGQVALTVSGGDGNDSITGGQGDDRLLGNAGDDVLIGGRGQDTLLGGAGSDRFVFTSGAIDADRVIGFQAHAGTPQGDLIVLNGFSEHSLGELLSSGHIVQSGADVAISDGGSGTIILQGVSLGALQDNDFLFG